MIVFGMLPLALGQLNSVLLPDYLWNFAFWYHTNSINEWTERAFTVRLIIL